MQALPKWRNVVVVKGLLFQPEKAATLASIHSSTAASSFYRRNANNSRSDGRSVQQPSKNYIRFATRQKRADTKRALKGLLFNDRFQDYFPNMKGKSCLKGDSADHSDSSKKKSCTKSSIRHANKAQRKRIKRKLQRESYTDDEYPERIFRATFGNKSYTWSFKSWEETNSRNSTNEFEWREHSNWSDSRNSRWQNPSDIMSDDESCSGGSSSDRRLLGLPSEGPLSIEDVKNAFRLSALKWHPDKHLGPSQDNAEEKFKLCVSAYKSLCSALSSA